MRQSAIAHTQEEVKEEDSYTEVQTLEGGGGGGNGQSTVSGVSESTH